MIIPTYKRKDKLKRLLNSLFESDYPKDKMEIIVVVDADGEDHSDLMEEFPKVRFIFNKEEKFLAESRNIGIKKSRGKHLFIIDDDNVIDTKCIVELVIFLEKNPKVGVVGPIMYYYKDHWRIWCAGIKRNYYTSLTKFIWRNEIDKGQFSETISSEDFPNAFMIKREVINKIGCFDSKNFPIHYDEADFCKRALNFGYAIRTLPTAKVWHDIDINRRGRFDNKLRIYYTARNRIIFHKKYSKWWQFLLFILIFNWLFTLYYLKEILLESKKPFEKRLKIAKVYLKGIMEGISK